MPTASCAIRALTLFASILTLTFMATGCARYVVPNQVADMTRFGLATAEQREQGADFEIRRRLELKPLAQFPVSIAAVHVQGQGYAARNTVTHGYGAYTVVLTREAERDEHFAKIAALSMVDQFGPVNRMMLPTRLDTDRDLRAAAATMRADMLLIYTFDTNIYLGGNTSPVDVITLGFLPHKKARVTTTASAVLLDTRNGYLYGSAESTATHEQSANTWTNQQAIDNARRKTEAEAFDQLVTEFTRVWPRVVNVYARPTISVR